MHTSYLGPERRLTKGRRETPDCDQCDTHISWTEKISKLVVSVSKVCAGQRILIVLVCCMIPVTASLLGGFALWVHAEQNSCDEKSQARDSLQDKRILNNKERHQNLIYHSMEIQTNLKALMEANGLQYKSNSYTEKPL